MTPKRRREKRTEPARVPLGVETPGIASAAPDRDERIRCRAYHLYIQRGQEPGNELEDWLQAERELESGLL